VTTSSSPWGTGNAEVPTYTDLMTYVRQDARSQLERTVRALGADGVVVSAMTLHVRSDECQTHPNGTDHFVEATITGTAIARFAVRRNATPAPRLAVLSLEPRAPGQRADRA
jgi:NAD(P)H-dependent flavin oxidoreductase YrpB (nitropropane dioxygenase family)